MEKVIQSETSKSGLNDISPLRNGYIVMTMVLLIWSGFSLTVRAIGASPLSIADVALIRFAVPLILLAPLVPSHLNAIKKIRFSGMLLVLLGGVPFLFLASLGAKTTPAAYVGTVLAGTPPFFVALLSYVFYRQKISMTQVFSLSLILAGIVTMVLDRTVNTASEITGGIFYLLSAAVIWAGYTMGLKRAGLNPITVAIILSYLSFIITLGLIYFELVTTNFGSFSFQEALPFVLVQGLGVGILATIGFSYAVNQLGSDKASIIGSISPGLTALLAVAIFDEPLSIVILCGIALIITGVILSNLS
ncbi:DMT family transporter [Vibrio sp. DW001]|uniref:DMT family transporter n=1 Tax=Vibrio sp. DW001 TaxID=2912315 RepID=UPI0023B0D833|nr:DMT family transporter [Vibrio sp. DW001]WED27545.1 DMT family transporter [Vibrio sp. DW001]